MKQSEGDRKASGAHNERRITPERCVRGKNGGEKDTRKTTNEDAGLDDGGWIQEAEGECWTTTRMATLDVRTCLGRERKKKNMVMNYECNAIV